MYVYFIIVAKKITSIQHRRIAIIQLYYAFYMIDFPLNSLFNAHVCFIKTINLSLQFFVQCTCNALLKRVI